MEYWDFKIEILMVNMKADPKTDKKYRPPWRQALKSWGSQERTNYLPLVVLRSDNNLTFDTFHVTNIRRGLSLSFHADSVVQIFQLHSSLSSCWVYSNLGTYTDMGPGLIYFNDLKYRIMTVYSVIYIRIWRRTRSAFMF